MLLLFKLFILKNIKFYIFVNVIQMVIDECVVRIADFNINTVGLKFIIYI